MRKGFLTYEEMHKYCRIYEGRRPLVINDFATAPFWISLYMRKILFLFYHCTIGAAHIFWSTQLQLHPILPHPAEYVISVIFFFDDAKKIQTVLKICITGSTATSSSSESDLGVHISTTFSGLSFFYPYYWLKCRRWATNKFFNILFFTLRSVFGLTYSRLLSSKLWNNIYLLIVSYSSNLRNS